jgi:ATP-dependent protease ClpP protease subunit
VTGHIYIYGEVGQEVTLDTVLKKITPSAENYVVHIHSRGGDVFEGFAIFNALKNTGKEIEVRIEGVCASIAASIASVASPGKLFMNSKGSFMIHNPRFDKISGQSKDLRNAADLLDQIRALFLKEWTARTGLNPEQLAQLYDSETWLGPDEAKQMGFVDEVEEVLKAVAKADYHKYKHMKDKNTILAFAEDFMNKVKSLWTPKAITDTLEDGTVITVNTEDGDWTGKTVTYEDGSPVPPGTYQLNGGRTLTIGENSTVETVTDPSVESEAKPEQEPENDMKLKEENDQLKARVAELESALQARNDATAKLEETKTKLEAKAKTLEDTLNVKVKALTDELRKFQETTVGDTTPPAKAINAPAANQPVVNDPMKQLFGQLIIDPRK